MGATKGGTFTGAGQSTPRDLSPHKGYPDLQAIAVQRCLYHGLTRLTARSTLFSCLVVRRRRVKSTPKGRPLIMRCMPYSRLLHHRRSTEMLLISVASRHFGPGTALGRTRRLNLEESV